MYNTTKSCTKTQPIYPTNSLWLITLPSLPPSFLSTHPKRNSGESNKVTKGGRREGKRWRKEKYKFWGYRIKLSSGGVRGIQGCLKHTAYYSWKNIKVHVLFSSLKWIKKSAPQVLEVRAIKGKTTMEESYRCGVTSLTLPNSASKIIKK